MVRRQEGRVSRRQAIISAAVSGCALSTGCIGINSAQSGKLEKVWGLAGSTPGRLFRPRAVAIDRDDLLYIVDMTPQIQVFTGDGVFLRGWQTPQFDRGRPSGLSFDNAGNLLVCDTHYFRVLVYTPQGELLQNQTIGGTCGNGDGEFQFVTDAAQDADGNYYVAQYGEYDRIQKFTSDHQFVLSWGEHGHEPGQFLRPQKIVIDKSGRVWVADFIYTTCEGPCPMMSKLMHQLQTLTAGMPDVKLVSFTVDPEHDSPPVLAAYAKHFQPDPARWS